MPNWCENVTTFKHSDSAQIKRLVDAFHEKKLFTEYLPCPKDADWWSWCVENWGTKWDVDPEDPAEYTVGDTEITLYFNTAWAPPLAFYRTMEDDLGFSIEAFYSEPGMAFAGRYADGDDDFYTDINAATLSEVPENIVEMFGLDSWYEEEDDEEV